MQLLLNNISYQNILLFIPNTYFCGALTRARTFRPNRRTETTTGGTAAEPTGCPLARKGEATAAAVTGHQTIAMVVKKNEKKKRKKK